MRKRKPGGVQKGTKKKQKIKNTKLGKNPSRSGCVALGGPLTSGRVSGKSEVTRPSVEQLCLSHSCSFFLSFFLFLLFSFFSFLRTAHRFPPPSVFEQVAFLVAPICDDQMVAIVSGVWCTFGYLLIFCFASISLDGVVAVHRLIVSRVASDFIRSADVLLGFYRVFFSGSSLRCSTKYWPPNFYAIQLTTRPNSCRRK